MRLTAATNAHRDHAALHCTLQMHTGTVQKRTLHLCTYVPCCAGERAVQRLGLPTSLSSLSSSSSSSLLSSAVRLRPTCSCRCEFTCQTVCTCVHAQVRMEG